jgi:hypothetical protein
MQLAIGRAVSEVSLDVVENNPKYRRLRIPMRRNWNPRIHHFRTEGDCIGDCNVIIRSLKWCRGIVRQGDVECGLAEAVEFWELNLESFKVWVCMGVNGCEMGVKW